MSSTHKTDNVEATPMMKQYMAAKKRHPGEILFFRMGDFYEMFFDDAQRASELLNITLTSRSKGTNPIPMAGVPVKSMKVYLKKLLDAGQRVAICEQVEDPAKAKGIVKRDVVRVITPGTLVDEDCMDDQAQLYLMALSPGRKESGIAWVDLSTGEFSVFESRQVQKIQSEIGRIGPVECLVPEEQARAGGLPILAALNQNGVSMTRFPDWHFGRDAAERQLKEHFDVASLEGFGITRRGPAVEAGGALLRYLYDTQKHELKHISGLHIHRSGGFLQIDGRTRKALEIIQNGQGGREGTLLNHLNKTCTAMGARRLRSWLLAPLCDLEQIEDRYDAVAALSEKSGLLSELRHSLKRINDIERLSGRLALGTAHPRDLLALGLSLSAVPDLKQLLADTSPTLIRSLMASADDFQPLRERITGTLVESPPLNPREGGLIRSGVSDELDELHGLTRESGAWLESFQQAQKARTGISTLKVGYHRVFGYYIEITHAQAGKVPPDYARKQTLKNCERYITPELKAYETKVLTARDRINDLEYAIFRDLREAAGEHIAGLQKTASCVAVLDALAALAHGANLYGYTRPALVSDKVLSITESRHPVVETSLQDDAFVANDIALTPDKPIAIITGPNMAGKSTYIRQAAIVALMAQVGSFIPAAQGTIGMVDRLFARVGAADDLYRGQSTFMVEMIETANILNNATERSLIILDEVGRGTSTFDGLSIAWAVTEHIFEKLGARTLFATHYHELTELSLLHPGIHNLNVAVKEYQDKIVFLRKIVPGGTDKSYGIHVARLAALPREVLSRAREILTNLECQSVSPNDLPAFAPPKEQPRYEELDFFSDQRAAMLQKLKKMDLNKTTPMEALQFLMALQEKVI